MGEKETRSLEQRKGRIGAALKAAFLPDQAADAELEKMIARLRGEQGSRGGSQA
jgi:hypothetical protein